MGFSILFPPNRYDGGRFQIGDTPYNFPINEPDRGNHLHGLCYDQPWELVELGSDDTESYALFTYTRTESAVSYGMVSSSVSNWGIICAICRGSHAADHS